MYARRRSPISPTRTRTLSSLFDLADQAEQFMAGVVERFHNDPSDLYVAVAMKRAVNDRGERVAIEVARFQPQRRGAAQRWMLITWNIDAVSINFRDYPTLRAAQADYRVVAAASEPQKECFAR